MMPFCVFLVFSNTREKGVKEDIMCINLVIFIMIFTIMITCLPVGLPIELLRL